MESVTLPESVVASFMKFKSNYEVANAMYNELKEHVGKYVVIDNGSILGYTDTYKEAKEKYGKSESVFIDLITDDNVFWIL